MYDIEVFVKPILGEMGFFEGKEVSVKKLFEKYLEVCPKGIGPLGVFKGIMEHELCLTLKEVKKVRVGNKITDYLFIGKPVNDLLYYDPRH